MGSIEVEAATLQLVALGFVKLSENGEKMYLTDKGIEHARDILRKLPMDEKLLVIMLGGDFAKKCAEDVDPED